jgi:selenocysteine lyase/cysteine desulfurase/glycine/D-amino acid oxidase-like deaminating enzyme
LSTPGTRHARHFNAAGAALPSETVLRTVVDHLNLEARIGGYEAAEAARERHEAVYASAARLIGARPEDVALVESATVGWHRALDALALPPGSRVLAAASSYVSSAMHLLDRARRDGITVEVLPVDPTGGTDLEALEKALREPAVLVTVAHVPTSSGLVEPVERIGRLTRAAGVALLLDATQSLGHVPLDVASAGVDIAVGTGRKFLRAPRGTGLLYVSPKWRERMHPAFPDVRGATWGADGSVEVEPGARRYETWEAAHALRLGLGAALDEALALGVPAIHAYVSALADALRGILTGLPGIRLTDPPASPSGIVTFVRDGEDPRDTVLRLRKAGVHVTSVPASHGQWDLGRRGIDAVVRASVHVYNDESDLAALAEALRSRTAPALVRTGDHADVVVVGAGIHGSATTWQLARRGIRVVQLDRHPDGHTEGSSHGHTRMIRKAYPSAFWDSLVDKAYASWDELSVATGSPLVTRTGGLYARSGGDPGPRGPGCRTVTAQEASLIFPGLRLEPGWTAVYDPAAGVIDAAAALTGLRKLALAEGADRRTGAAVRWQPDGSGVRVVTEDGVVTADRLVVCAGPWTSELVPQFAPLLTVQRIVTVFLRARDPRLTAPPGLGVFSAAVPDAGLLFGIPAIGGSALKVGLEPGPADDTRPQWAPTGAENARLAELALRFLPGLDGSVVDSAACRYTMAPRNRFAIGELPATPQVLVGVACSGHGFKFGPAVGEALADLATGIARPDLDELTPAAMGIAR